MEGLVASRSVADSQTRVKGCKKRNQDRLEDLKEVQNKETERR